jgi:hypothetical protein
LRRVLQPEHHTRFAETTRSRQNDMPGSEFVRNDLNKSITPVKITAAHWCPNSITYHPDYSFLLQRVCFTTGAFYNNAVVKVNNFF